MKGGLGSASMRMDDGTLVGAIVVVNAMGDVIDPQTQHTIAGARNPLGGFILPNPFGNTTIAVVATDASLSKEGVNKVAQMAHNGLAQAIRPAHTMFDGDAVFALALGPREQAPPDPATSASRVSSIGATASITLARAIVKAVRAATDLHGVPATHG
jgi:L-aminopeptidase/D-esterase-like protein